MVVVLLISVVVALLGGVLLHHFWFMPTTERSSRQEMKKLAVQPQPVDPAGWMMYLLLVKTLYILRGPAILYRVIAHPVRCWAKRRFGDKDPSVADLRFRRQAAQMLLNSSACSGFIGKMKEKEGEGEGKGTFLKFRFEEVALPRKDATKIFRVKLLDIRVKLRKGSTLNDEERYEVVDASRDGEALTTGQDLYNAINALVVLNSHVAVHALGGTALPESKHNQQQQLQLQQRRQQQGRAELRREEELLRVPMSTYGSIQGLNLAANYYPGTVSGVSHSVYQGWLSTHRDSPTWSDHKNMIPHMAELQKHSWFARIVMACHRVLAQEFHLTGMAASTILAVWLMHEIDHWSTSSYLVEPSEDTLKTKSLHNINTIFGYHSKYSLMQSNWFSPCPVRHEMMKRLKEVVGDIKPEVRHLVGRAVWCC